MYEDSGYSGGDLNRPALRQLLDDMQSDKVDGVVVHRLDRLSRSVRNLRILLPLFTIPGIRLVSVSQPLDTGTPEGRLNNRMLIREQFRNPQQLLEGLRVECSDDPGIDEAHIIQALNKLDVAWHLFIDKTQAHLMLTLVERVTLRPDGIAIRWNLRRLAALIRQIRSQPATDQAG